MKINSFVILLFLFTFSSVSFAQSVVITPKKVIYKRPKPQMDFKKSFEITYPKVKASTPALSRKIEATISYQKNNNLNLREELNEYQWLEIAGYEVNYNKNGLLDIALSMEGSAAYPSSFTHYVVVDLKTGNLVRPQDIFVNLAGLAAKARNAQLAEIKSAQAEYKKDPENSDFDGSDYFNDAKFGVKELKEFTISDKGVAFFYHYGFAHVILALEPEGKYFFSWKELKPFIKPGGLLAKLVR